MRKCRNRFLAVTYGCAIVLIYFEAEQRPNVQIPGRVPVLPRTADFLLVFVRVLLSVCLFSISLIADLRPEGRIAIVLSVYLSVSNITQKGVHGFG